MYEALVVPRTNPAVTVANFAAFSRFDVPVQFDTASPPNLTPEYQLITTMLEAATDAVEQLAGVSLCQETWELTFDFFPGTQDPRQFYNYQLGWGYNWIPYWWFGFPVTDSIEFIRRPVMIGGSPPLDPVITYDDADGNPQIMDSSLYTVRANKITLIPGNAWPPTSRLADCIRIQYTAGYSANASSVPARLQMAIMFLAGWWWENRLLAGTEPTTEVMFTLCSLVQPYKTMRIPR